MKSQLELASIAMELVDSLPNPDYGVGTEVEMAIKYSYMDFDEKMFKERRDQLLKLKSRGKVSGGIESHEITLLDILLKHFPT